MIIPDVLYKLTNAPHVPGVYRMIAANKLVLYIGKAKNLHNRLLSYTSHDISARMSKMIAETSTIEYTITKTEREAIFLESRLIKALKPKYNILLKDDKDFSYLQITTSDQYPRLLRHRGKNFDPKSTFFGPFASSIYLDVTIKTITQIFKIRTCSDKYFKSRTRPCIQYQINRCSAPCVKKITESEYRDGARQLEQFLANGAESIIVGMQKEMQQYSKMEMYEKAANRRDAILAIKQMNQKNNLLAHNIHDADVICAALSDNTCVIQVFIFRSNQFLGNKVYFPENIADATKEEILEEFLYKFYRHNTPPKEILIRDLSKDTIKNIELFLQGLYSSKFAIKVPKGGSKYNVMAYVSYNAEIVLADHVANNATGIK